MFELKDDCIFIYIPLLSRHLGNAYVGRVKVNLVINWLKSLWPPVIFDTWEVKIL